MLKEKLCREVVGMVVKELDKHQNKETIKHDLLDPCIEYIGSKLYPYIVTTALVVAVIVLLLFYIVYTLFKRK